MFKKDLKISLNIFAFLMVIVSLVNTTSFNAQEVSGLDTTLNSCLTTKLSVDKSEITSGGQIQVNFEYESVKPACSPKEVTGKTIEVDLSGLVDAGVDIKPSYDTSHFTIDISSDGIATLTFKDLSKDNETLIGFGGNVVFTVTIKETITDDDVTISDSEGNTINIHVDGNTHAPANSNKVSSVDYAAVGDVIDYTVLINNDKNKVDNLRVIDTASAGLEYVDGSFWAEEDGTWIKANDLFNASVNSGGHGEVVNTQVFDSAYLLHYKMKVTEKHETYSNAVDLTYDTINEHVSDDVSFDVGGGSWISYDKASIDLNKVDQDNNPLEGVEFTVYDKAGNVVDVILTDVNGYAQSKKLALGTYTVKETKALEGYQGSDQVFTVVLDGSVDNVSVAGGAPIVNNKISNKDSIEDEKNVSDEVDQPRNLAVTGMKPNVVSLSVLFAVLGCILIFKRKIRS